MCDFKALNTLVYLPFQPSKDCIFHFSVLSSHGYPICLPGASDTRAKHLHLSLVFLHPLRARSAHWVPINDISEKHRLPLDGRMWIIASVVLKMPFRGPRNSQSSSCSSSYSSRTHVSHQVPRHQLNWETQKKNPNDWCFFASVCVKTIEQ